MAPKKPLEEAYDHMKRGRAALKKRSILFVFKTSPDYSMAEIEFNQAARCFQLAGATELCCEAYTEVAELREKTFDYFGAGRGYEAAGAALKTKATDKKLLDLLEKAASAYEKSDKPESGARLLSKLASTYEESLNDVEKTAAAHKRSIHLLMSNEKEADEQCKHYVNFLCRHQMYEAALEGLDTLLQALSKRKQSSQASKAVLGKIVIHLYLGNIEAARNVMENPCHDSFVGSNESDAAEDLLQAFKTDSQELLDQVLSQQIWKFLLLEIVKIVQLLKLRDTKVRSSSDMAALLC